jgi:hypothetical protein
MAIQSTIRIFGICCGHSGVFCGNLEHFPPFWYVLSRKIWQPWIGREKKQDFVSLNDETAENLDRSISACLPSFRIFLVRLD